MRRVPSFAYATLSSVLLLSVSASGASSPYPATLTMQFGLSQSASGQALPWGTILSSAQARNVVFRSPVASSMWGVWKRNGGSGQFPVRSTDDGVRWRASGPQLATDWAGGGIYFVNRVFSVGTNSVVMVSNAVIDVSTDGGHRWYQYLNSADSWSMRARAIPGGGIGLRISPASYSTLPKSSYATYVLNTTHHQWRRVSQSLA